MLTKYIRWAFYSLFLLTPLIMNSQTSEIFEFNKMLLIYGLGTIIFGLYLSEQILIHRTVFKPRILIIFFLFLLSQMISTFVSIDPHTSLYGYYGRFNGGLLSIITYIGLLFVFINVFDKQSLYRLLKISILSSAIVLLWGFTGKLGFDLSCLVFTGKLTNACWTDQFQPAVRMFSTIGQPNWLGAYLAIHFFIASYFILSDKEENQKGFLSFLSPEQKNIIYQLYLLANFAGILFTRSRSALVAVIVGLLCLAITLFLIDKKRLTQFVPRRLGALAVGALLLVIIFKTGIPKVDSVLRPFSHSHTVTVNDNSDIPNQPAPVTSIGVTESFDIRKIVWKGAFELALRYPLFGTGVETFAYSYYFTRPAQHNLTSEWDFIYNKAHNEYLNFLATTGFIGLTTYLLIIICTVIFYLKILLRKRNTGNEKILISTLFSAYITILITNFFGFSTTTINLFFYILSGVPFILDRVIETKGEKKKRVWWQYGGVGVTSLVSLYLLWQVITYYRADVLYASATRSIASNEYQSALYSLDDALHLRYEHVYEDKLANVLANLAYVAMEQKEKDLSAKLMSLATGYNNKSLQEAPKNVLYWKTKAKNEFLFYQFTSDKQHVQRAIEALNIAQELAPTDPKLPYSQALFYSELVDNTAKTAQYKQKSLQDIDRAIALKSNFREAYLLKGQLYKTYNDKQKAAQMFQFILKNIDPNDADAKKELQSLSK